MILVQYNTPFCSLHDAPYRYKHSRGTASECAVNLTIEGASIDSTAVASQYCSERSSNHYALGEETLPGMRIEEISRGS